MKKLFVALAFVAMTACVKSPEPVSADAMACTKKGEACADHSACCSGSCSVTTHKCM